MHPFSSRLQRLEVTVFPLVLKIHLLNAVHGAVSSYSRGLLAERIQEEVRQQKISWWAAAWVSRDLGILGSSHSNCKWSTIHDWLGLNHESTKGFIIKLWSMVAQQGCENVPHRLNLTLPGTSHMASMGYIHFVIHLVSFFLEALVLWSERGFWSSFPGLNGSGKLGHDGRQSGGKH